MAALTKRFCRHPLAWSVVLSCGLFVLLAGQFFWVTPILETSDSTSHYQYIHGLARRGEFPTLPTKDWLYSPAEEAGQFPLYYLIGAALVQPFSDADLDAVLIPDPHNAAGAGFTKNYSFHKPFSGIPHGAELAVRVVELFSIVCGATTVACAVLLARSFRPDKPGLWLGAGAAAAVLPAFDFISSGVSNDHLVIALSSVTLVLLAAWLGDGRTRWGWLAAIALALAVLAKFNAIGLIGCYALVAGWRRNVWAGLGRLALSVAIVDGWWIVRNLRLYGDPSGMVAINREMYGPEYAPFKTTLGAALGHIGTELPKAFHTFFVAFGHYNVDAPRAFVLVAALGSLGLLAGVVAGLREWRLPMAQLILLWPALVLLEVVAYVVLSNADGRFMYPALAPLAVLAAVGWERIRSVLRWRMVGYGLVGACAATSAACAWLVVGPAFAYPPLIGSVPAAAAPVQARFANSVELLGAEVPAEEPVTLALYWRRTGPLDLPLSEFIHIQSSDPAYDPGGDYEGATGGNLPPNFWPAGQVVVDRHTLNLKPDARPDRRNAVLLTLRTGMYYLSGHAGDPVRRVAAEPAEAGDSGIEVGRVKLPGRAPAPTGQPLAQFVNGLDLVEAQLSGSTVALRWLATVAPSAEATVFVQALSADGRLLGQHDSYPLEGRYPTSWWSSGEQVFDNVPLRTSRPLTAQDRVIVGMYVLPDADKRIPTTGGQAFATVG